MGNIKLNKLAKSINKKLVIATTKILVSLSVITYLLISGTSCDKQPDKIIIKLDTVYHSIDTTQLVSDLLAASGKKITIKDDDAKYFINRFAKVAIAEKSKFGILPSVWLGLGLLANNGCVTDICNDPSNNYFNIYDDNWDPEFIPNKKYSNFESPWLSCRRFSQIISPMFDYHIKSGITDHRSWLSSMMDDGTITHRQYIIINSLIDKYKLYEFDNG